MHVLHMHAWPGCANDATVLERRMISIRPRSVKVNSPGWGDSLAGSPAGVAALASQPWGGLRYSPSPALLKARYLVQYLRTSPERYAWLARSYCWEEVLTLYTTGT